MSMHNKNLSARVWEGDRTVVDEARQRFYKNREEQLIPWVSTLYSFRKDDVFRQELLGYVSTMLRRAVRLTEELMVEQTREKASKADTLSRILFSMANDRDYALQTDRRHTMLLVSKELAEAGLRADFLPGDHTPVLLLITLGMIERNRERRDWHLSRAIDLANDVDDPRQRVRCLKGIGQLHLMQKRPVSGFRYLLRALRTPGVPVEVRRKIFRR